VAIKYKENNQQNNLSRYEAQPGARSFRRIFGESEEEVKTPSLSSSSSSHTTTMIPEETIPQQNSPTPTSTLSFLARNHTLGRNTKKPKTNITKTNSSFVQRIITNDQLAKILMARTSEDTNLFYNCGTSFVWMDAGGHPKVSLLNKRRVNVNEIIMCVIIKKEPLSRIVFARACPTSHDVNLLTRGADQLDVIIGFSSGDIMWFDPLCNKYGRINKGVSFHFIYYL
jgi:hypothetical protein